MLTSERAVRLLAFVRGLLKSHLFWFIVGLCVASAIRTHYSNFHNGSSLGEYLFDGLFEIIGVAAFVCFLNWRGRLSYGFISLYAFVAIASKIGLIYLHLKDFGFQLILSERYLTITLALDIIIAILALPILFLSIRFLRFTIATENRLKKMNITELFSALFEATQVFWECDRAKDQSLATIQRDAGRDIEWTRHELKRRDPHLDELALGVTSVDEEVRNKAIDEIIEKYGKSALTPLEKGWNARGSRYFKN